MTAKDDKGLFSLVDAFAKKERKTDFSFYELEARVTLGRQILNYMETLRKSQEFIISLSSVQACLISIKRQNDGASTLISSEYKPNCDLDFKDLFCQVALRIIEQQLLEAKEDFKRLNIGAL